MATLTGELISETYDSLLKVTDNNTITGIKKRITDGFGNDIPLLLSSTDLEIDGTLILSALTDLAPATKFLSLKADNSVGFRTSSELLSDIGGASSASISGTTGRLSKFTSSGAVGNSILNEIGNAIHLTDGTSSYASFGINNPGVDNDAYIGSTINNDFLIKINNVEALRIDTAFRLKIANIQNALADTDKFLVSEDGVVKYRTGSEVLSDIGAVPYTGATSNVDLGAFNITANSLIKAGGVDTQFLKADGSVDNNNYLTANDLPSTLSLYATNVPSAVAGYFKLVTTIDDPDYNTIAVDVPTGEITTTNQLIASLVSPVNLINGNPGVFNVTTTGNITRLSGSGEAEFFFRIYKRDSVGVETLVGTSGNTIPVINTGYSEFFATAIWNDGVFDVTDSIVLKYYANRIAGGSNPTYQFQFGGDQPVRTIVPIPTAVIPNIFLEQLADVEDGTEANNDGIFFDSSVSLWKYKSVAEVLGYTPVSSTGTLNYIPKFSGANSLINSTIFEDATGVAIGVPFSDPSFLLYVNGGIKANGNSTINGDLTSNKFIVPGGTSSQFLKANGSLDSNSYALASSLSGYVPYTGATGLVNLGAYDLTVNGVSVGRGGGAINSNILVGSQSGLNNTTGSFNSFFGSYAGNSNTTGSNNSFFGSYAGVFNTTGSFNTLIGHYAGAYINSGAINSISTNSVYLGYDTRASVNGNTNEIVIGDSARGGGSNSATLGNTSIATTILHGNTSIGYTTNPSLYKLDVNGTGRFGGDLTGTSATFSGSVIVGTTALLNFGPTSKFVGMSGNNSTGALQLYANNVDVLSFAASTGAATFSSSVTSAISSGAFGFHVTGGDQSYVRLRLTNTGSDGRAYSIVSGNPGITNIGFSVYDETAAATRLHITANGNVGIGTTTPNDKLDVNGAIRFRANTPNFTASVDNGVIDFVPTSIFATNPCIRIVAVGSTTVGADIRFLTGDSTTLDERMRITSGGNVLIGTTTDNGAKLQVNGAALLGPSTSSLAIGSISGIRRIQWNESTNELEVLNGSNAFAPVGASAFNTRSDYRLKQDLKEYNGIDLISKIKTYDYEWVCDNTRSYGVMAHELQQIIPNAVTGQKDAEQMQGVDYSKLVPVLIKAIQELKAEIDLLKNK